MPQTIVGLNSYFLRERFVGTGLNRYTAQIAERFLPETEFEVVRIHPRRSILPGAGSKTPEEMFWELFLLPGAARKVGVDLIHSPYWTVPAIACPPLVVTIHDVIPITSFSPGLKQLHWLLYYRSLRANSHRIGAVIAPSEWTKREIQQHLAIPADRIHVVRLGGDHLVARFPEIVDIDRGDDYVLTIISADPDRKNLVRSALALSTFRKTCGPYKLMVAGSTPAATVREHLARVGLDSALGDWITFEEGPDDERMARLYAGARALLFPSLGEGFGLPIVEAYSFGTPVVTSCTSACGELAEQGGAVVCDPESVDSIVEALGAVLTDTTEWGRLSAAARAQSARLSWASTWEQTKQVYRAVLDS